MKFRFGFKAQDDTPKRTYMDQRMIEVYDLYDKKSGESTPQVILDSPEIGEQYGSIQVRIKYPIYQGIFTLNGGIGNASQFVEAGKKAFVRGGTYTHPEAGYTVELKEMTPMEYAEECRKMFVSRGGVEETLEELLDSRTDYDVMSFDRVAGNIFPPVIDYFRKDQEGLHRAIYAQKKGLEKIQVVVIR